MARISYPTGIFVPGDVSRVIRLGSAGSFVIQPGSELRRTTTGLDEITRIWLGPKELAANFADSQSVDPDFPLLYKVDSRVLLRDGGQSEVSVTFRGFAGTSPTKSWNHLTQNSLALETSEFFFQTVDSTASLSISVQYLAPSTTHTWLTANRPPDTPEFTGVESGLNPWDFVQSWKVDASNVTGSIDDLIAYLKTNVTATEHVTSYETTPEVESKMWSCSSTTTKKFLQAVFINNS